jgi:hypothetical protein
MSLKRRVSFLCGAAILAVGYTCAQSISSSTSSSSSTLSTAESSSSAFQLMAEDSLDNSAALPSLAALPAAGGSGAGAGQSEHGWKHSLSNNYAIELGAGFNAPIGNDTPYITWGGNFYCRRRATLLQALFRADRIPVAR